jgi:hypothetical protein
MLRALAPVLFATLGSCDLLCPDDPGTTPPTDTADSGTTDSGTTTDTGTTIVAGTNPPIDLSIASGDEEYDRYTLLIMELDELLAPTGPPQKQIDTGWTVLADPLGGQLGSVWVDLPPSEWRAVEHWFLNQAADGYTGQGDFVAEFQKKQGWSKTRDEIESYDPDWQSHAYLRMDIEYKQPPAELNGLCYAGPVVERWSYEVRQEGVVQASLLRELHHHAKLGDTFVDFWTFQAGYDFLSVAGDTLEATDLGAAPAPPCGWYGAPGTTLFARVIYDLEEGVDFDF